MNIPLQVALIVICIILSAYFSATETAFSTFNRIRIKNMAEKGNKRAARVIKLSDNYDKLISTILIGNNIVNILSASLATMLFVELLQSNDLGSTVSTAVMTAAVLIFGEISPKSIAKKNPEAFALFSAPVIFFLLCLFAPFTYIFSLWQRLLSKMFKSGNDKGMTEEELISIIEEAEEEGDFNKEESSLIKSAIEFNDLEIGDILTPRIDITAIPASMELSEITKIFIESGYSRLPVYEDNLDNVVGIVYYKDFFTLATEGANFNLSDILKPVIYVPKTQAIKDLLKELQAKQVHMAIVMDEFGSTAGIVTLEDVIEEIVGDIWDEHDEIIEEIQEVAEKEYKVDGMTSITKLFDLLDIDEECESSTVNGWAISILGRIPEVGDTFSALGLNVEILETDGKKILSLRIVDARDTNGETDDNEKEDKED